jgi:N-acetylglucosaminyl-diphospho-decaprenol L-rhamnosyltransferase
MTSPFPRVDVVIVHYGPPEATVRATRAVLATGWPVAVVDNDGGFDLRDGGPRLRVLRPGANVGYTRAVNMAARGGTAPWLLLLNPDTEPDPEALTRLVDIADERDDVAALAPSLVYFDGSPQITGGRFAGWIREAGRISGAGRRLRGARTALRSEFRSGRQGPARTIDREWVSGAVMLVRRAAFDAAGGLDERFFMYYEDEDLCRRLRARGWRIAVTPEVIVRHAVQGSSGGPGASPPAYEESRALYHRIHSGPLLRRIVAWDSARRLGSGAG